MAHGDDVLSIKADGSVRIEHPSIGSLIYATARHDSSGGARGPEAKPATDQCVSHVGLKRCREASPRISASEVPYPTAKLLPPLLIALLAPAQNAAPDISIAVKQQQPRIRPGLIAQRTVVLLI